MLIISHIVKESAQLRDHVGEGSIVSLKILYCLQGEHSIELFHYNILYSLAIFSHYINIYL